MTRLLIAIAIGLYADRTTAQAPDREAELERLRVLREESRSEDPAAGGPAARTLIGISDSLLNAGARDREIQEHKGGGLWNYGRHYDRRNLPDSASFWYRKALAHWRSTGNEKMVAFGEQFLAEQLIDRGKADEALPMLERVLEYREATADTSGMVDALTTIGLARYMTGDFAAALGNNLRSLRLAEAHGLEAAKARNFLRIGLVYQDQQRADSALAYYDRSVKAFLSSGDTLGAITPLNNAALIHLDRKRPEEALRVCEKGLSLVDRNEHPGPTSILTSTLGTVYRELGEMDRAIAIGEQALDDVAHSPVADFKATVLINLARSLHADGDQQRALKVAKQAEALFDSLDLSLHREMFLEELLASINESLGRSEEALQHHKRFAVLKDSVANENIRRELQRYELFAQALRDSLRHATEVERLEAARTIESLRADRTRNNAIAFGVVAVLLIAGGAAFFITDRKRRRAKHEKEAAVLETQALRSQMNPHFIFNALNSINAFVQKNDPDRAGSFLTRFARLMRLVLENSRQAEVPLKDDLEALDAYLHLERVRSGEKFDYTIKVDPEIDQEDVLVPPLVVQPFVENAIWHGMNGKEGKGQITLSVSVRGDDLVMAIEDDGVGRNAPKKVEAEPPKKTSLATTITQARLDLVEKQRGRPAGFRIIDLPQGTRVELSIPL